MFRVIRKDLSVEEVPDSAYARVDGNHLRCLDAHGRMVAFFDQQEILAYGDGPALEALLQADGTAAPSDSD